MMSATIMGIGRAGAGAIASGGTTLDPDTPLGQLERLGQQMEQAGREMDAAQQRGDGAGQAAAAMNALGTLLGGGTRVEPVQLDALRPFVPDTFAGLARTDTSSERTGLAGIMVARAEARYGSGDRTATLEVQDTGGISGLVGLASWMGVEGEREDSSSIERNGRVNGRLTHELTSKTGGSNEYAVVIAERFVVSATGRGLSVDDLRSAVSGLDLAELESLK
jgi:hypothetical protein